MLKAIVFDFDGVIVDSEPVHFQAFVEVSRELDFTFGYDDYLRRYVGFDDRDAFRHILADAGLPLNDARVAELGARKQAAFERIAAGGVAMIPGARALIEAASERGGGMPIAIASGATTADIELILAGLSLRDRFEVVVTADDVAHSKPHPDTYALAAQRLARDRPSESITPSTCLAIEDTAAGLASAADAGMATLALTTTGPAQSLARADRIVPDLTHVSVDQLRQWYGG